MAQRLVLSMHKAARDYTCSKCHGDILKGTMYVRAEVKQYNDKTLKVYASQRYPEHRVCPVSEEELNAVFEKARDACNGYMEDFDLRGTYEAVLELLEQKGIQVK